MCGDLKIGGKTDASTPNDMPTQLLLGTLPFLARPDEVLFLLPNRMGVGPEC